MSQKLKASVTRIWIRLKYEELGAQTLEWLALALLILGILGAGSAVVNDGAFLKALKEKFLDMVNNINKSGS
jgi:hypothetical protein